VAYTLEDLKGLSEAFIVNGIDQRKLIVLHHRPFEDGK
jgi:hypothetical protein